MMRLVLALVASAAAARRPAALRVKKAPLALRVVRGGYASPLRVAGDAYGAALAANPTRTNCATAAVLAVCADRFAQRLTSKEWDARRSGAIAFWGAGVSGYALSKWLALLARWFPQAATSDAQLAAKVFVNQLVCSPGMNAGFFFFVVLTRDAPFLRMSQRNRRDLALKLRADLPATMARSCAFWVCVQTLNFRYLPPRYAVFVSNIAFLLWNTYLSLIGHRKPSS